MPYPAFYSLLRFRSRLVGFYHTDFPIAYVKPAVTSAAGRSAGETARILSEGYARFVYNRCHLNLTSSQQLYSRLAQMGIQRVCLIHLGVDLEEFHPGKRDLRLRRRLGVKDHEILFIYTGRVDHEKRTELLVDAFLKASRFITAKLVIVGEGILKHRIQERSRNNPEIQCIPFQKNRSELAALLASSDIYVTAGPHETFGLSIIEAQACGLPVLGVRAGALIDRIPDSVGVLCKKDSIEDLSGGLVSLAENGYLRKGQEARKLVEKQFSWEKTFDELFGRYRTLVAERN
jgi:alpha-1,6-mannosyltransferase